ncbi:MAG: hypothetical protein AAF653_02940 [Chloroflexota bacterium]
MNRISAADNLIINAQPDRWQMLVNTEFVDNIQGDGLLLEAAPGEPLRYTTAFARTHRLPRSGELSTQYVQRVVLGFSQDDDAWHLGLLFQQPLADARGSRWCELARWPDPEQDVFQDIAIESGQKLAQVLNRPFNIIPLRKQQPVEVKLNIPLPPLPLPVQGWTFDKQPNGWLTFERDNAWRNEQIRRIVWYSFWVVVYIILSLGTLFSDIALPRPEFLPYLGLGTAIFLAGLVIYTMYRLRSTPRRIVVDPQTHQIWGSVEEGDKPRWRMGRESIDSVYVSQVVGEEKGQPIVQYGELNLRLTDGGYYYLIQQEEAEPVRFTDETSQWNGHSEIVPLQNDNIHTELQATGAYIARALNVPVWYDHRLR